MDLVGFFLTPNNCLCIIFSEPGWISIEEASSQSSVIDQQARGGPIVVSDVHIRANERSTQNSLLLTGCLAPRCHQLCKAKPISGRATSLQMVPGAVVTRQQAARPGAEAKPIKANLPGPPRRRRRKGQGPEIGVLGTPWRTLSRQTNPISKGPQSQRKSLQKHEVRGPWLRTDNVKQTQSHSQALGIGAESGRRLIARATWCIFGAKAVLWQNGTMDL